MTMDEIITLFTELQMQPIRVKDAIQLAVQ